MSLYSTRTRIHSGQLGPHVALDPSCDNFPLLSATHTGGVSQVLATLALGFTLVISISSCLSIVFLNILMATQREHSFRWNMGLINLRIDEGPRGGALHSNTLIKTMGVIMEHYTHEERSHFSLFDERCCIKISHKL